MLNDLRADRAYETPTHAGFRIALAIAAWAMMIAGGVIESLPISFGGALLLIISVIVELDHLTSRRRAIPVRTGLPEGRHD